MRKILPFFCIIAIVFIGCETEDLSTITEAPEAALEIEDQAEAETPIDIEEVDFDVIQQSFIEELNGLNLEEIESLDLDVISTADLEESTDDKEVNSTYYSYRPRLTSICLVKDADRCPFEDRQPMSNMWWPENETDFFNPTAYFSSTNRRKLIFATFSNGTALIRGITTMNEGSCKVFVNVWLKDRKTYGEFSAMGGEFKLEPGCASQAADKEDLVYYDIDASRSRIAAWGDDCLGTGVYGLELRGDSSPSNPNTESSNFRGQLGANGAGFDSNIGALGFSSWGFITDRYTGEQLWVMDFDFRLWCKNLRRKH